MGQNQDINEEGRGGRSRGPVNIGSFLLAFFFVWLVFDNLALGLLVGLMFGGGSEVAQRVADKKTD